MIVLAVLLWIQVGLLTTLGLATVHVAAKDENAPVATVAGVFFTTVVAISAWAAVAIGGLT